MVPALQESWTFSAQIPTPSPHTSTIALQGRCPTCNKRVAFVAIGCTTDPGAETRCAFIVMHPSLVEHDSRLDDFEFFSPDERFVELHDHAKTNFMVGDY